MKVALIVPGGVDRSGEYRVIPCLLWLIERLASRVELHVFALNQEPRPCRYELLGAMVHNVGARPRRARLFTMLLSEHRRRPFHLLHAVWAAQGAIAAVVGRLLGIPVLLHLTGGDLAALPDIDYGLLLRRRGRVQLWLAVAGSAKVTVPSLAMQRSAASLGVRAERLVMGVALDRWPPLAPRARPADRPARLVHVASLNRVKDQGTLLRALHLVRERGLAFHLDVIGEDTLDGDVQRVATACGLSDVASFHGFLPHRLARSLVERADLLVMSSRHEADPVALLEGAVAGVPAVGTNVGHFVEWAPEAAVAVPVQDHGALAQGITELLQDDRKRLALAAAAQARALRDDADRGAARTMEFYLDLTEGQRRSQRRLAGGRSSTRPSDRGQVQ